MKENPLNTTLDQYVIDNGQETNLVTITYSASNTINTFINHQSKPLVRRNAYNDHIDNALLDAAVRCYDIERPEHTALDDNEATDFLAELGITAIPLMRHLVEIDRTRREEEELNSMGTDVIDGSKY